MWVPKLLFPPVKIGIFGPKTAKFCPIYAFLFILDLILACLVHLMPCPTEKQCKRGAYVDYRYVGTRTFAPSQNNKGVWSENSHFCPKICFRWHIHLMPCWLVGWWLSCAGCISQDTYFLYYGHPIQTNNKTIGLNISYPKIVPGESCSRLSESLTTACPPPPTAAFSIYLLSITTFHCTHKVTQMGWIFQSFKPYHRNASRWKVGKIT